MDWEFIPHVILQRNEKKEGVVGRGIHEKKRIEGRLSSQVRGRSGKMNVF
jgi:hypothetical protein